ncbi:MAG: acyl-ACP--UDP-N-acetylglucosamine O-acyltransferase [Planctomycetota bacterium]
MNVHPTAIVSPKAEIDESVEIGPYAIVEDDVRIGAGTRIMAHAVIRRYTTIGENNSIHFGAVIGDDPQDVSFRPEVRSTVEIGRNNRIREYVTIHRGTKEGGRTIIGDGNFLFAQSHVAHDVQLGNHIVLANSAALGGHVKVGDRAFISGGVMIHQFTWIGRLAMLSGNSAFSRNVPPFATALGQNLYGTVNVVGLRRTGIPRETMREIRRAYEIFYSSSGSVAEALAEIEAAGFVSNEVKELVDFIRNSKRPIIYDYRRRKGYQELQFPEDEGERE